MVGTRGVDQSIDSAPVGVHSCNQFPGSLGFGDIALMSSASDSLCLDGSDRFIGLRGAGAVTNCYGPAARCEIERNAAADAASAAGY